MLIEVRCDLDDRKPYEKMKADFHGRVRDAKAVAANGGCGDGQVATDGQRVRVRHAQGQPPKRLASSILHKRRCGSAPTNLTDFEELLRWRTRRANTIIAYTYQEELAELKRRYKHAHHP